MHYDMKLRIIGENVMDEYGTHKKYESSKIPNRQQIQEKGSNQSLSQIKTNHPASSDGLYYEIEYDSHPIPGVGKFVPKPQKIQEPEKDEIRDLFGQMRDIAREHRSTLGFSRFFDRRLHHDNELIFYKQGMFMKDFTDDYTNSIPFSQYYPYYQMMGYEQLRTYFTWRTEVRKGTVTDTSLSYAFLYIYELLGNIGINDPQDGLDKLISFWKAFRVHNEAIDKYVLLWLKDYHIYYELAQSFNEFIEQNNLIEYYPEIADANDKFKLFCSISKYDIRKSTFFSDDKAELITDCFYFVTNKLRQIFMDNGINFDESIFQPTKKMSIWIPFKGARFYQWAEQRDRRVVLSESEIYICSQKQWAFSTAITTESGRQLMGYIMKQMESALRKIMKHKFKLTANIDAVTHPVIDKLNETGNSLEDIIDSAVLEFYREATKTVVKVDPSALSIIRQEALTTQEKLIVPEQEEEVANILVPSNVSLIAPKEIPTSPRECEPISMSGPWESLKNTLTETEIKALSVVLHDEMEIKKFADECGIMLEVLIDGINEKAMDYIGDNLLDEDFVLYDDYKEQVKELIK